jgi:hypothetical protein
MASVSTTRKTPRPQMGLHGNARRRRPGELGRHPGHPQTLVYILKLLYLAGKVSRQRITTEALIYAAIALRSYHRPSGHSPKWAYFRIGYNPTGTSKTPYFTA